MSFLNRLRQRFQPNPHTIDSAAIDPILPVLAEPIVSDLKSTDRLVCIGDSITHASAEPQGFLTQIRSVLPNLAMQSYGLSGGRAADLWSGRTTWSQSTPYREILQTQPTIVILYIGVNDLWHKPPTAANAFQQQLTELIQATKAITPTVIVATPAVIGETLTNPQDPSLNQFQHLIQTLTIAQQVTLCDLRAAFTQYLQSHNSAGLNQGILTTDGVHMNPQGNQLIAETILKSLAIALHQR
jgi:isoamyl acetate esterase